MSKKRLINRLSLSQRERIEVRDYSVCVFQARTRSLGEHCRALLALDDSRIELQQFLVWLEILLALDRVSLEAGIRGLNHRAQLPASRPDSRNPRCKDRSDAVVETCNRRSFDSENGARESVRSRSHAYGDNWHGSLGDCLATAIPCEKHNPPPLTSILSLQPGRGGLEDVLR